jgi:hypothetical protein
MRALAVWLLLMTVEVGHGIARAVWLVPVVGDVRARQLGVLSGSALVLLVATLTARWMRLRSRPLLLGAGLLWAALTLLFEVGIGRLLGYSWDRLWSDYDLLHGGLMPLGLAVMALAPLAAARLRGISLER